MSTSRTPLLRTRLLTLALGAALTGNASAAWMWDADGDRIDDRIERVQAEGLQAAYEHLDLDGRLRFAVDATDPAAPRYGVYVGFDHHPTQADLDALRASGVDTRVLRTYVSIPYVRMALSFEEIATVAALPGVTRVESIPMMYALNNNAVKTSGVGFSNYRRFPTVHRELGITGRDVVVAVLDTGVNDAPDALTGFPGHESFPGKFVAGGNFFAGDPALNTGIDDSENPVDRGEQLASTHGTHVAGTAIGTGGGTGVFGGVAPGARLVDLKVLSDAGAGFGSADGVDWAVANKDRYGIQVMNLSLGGLDESDGTDAGSQAINRAFEAGIVAVIATGNDAQTDYISSPAAADHALAIGSLADRNSITRDDDLVSDFSNEGPRNDDGDADFLDEMKPLVAAPGSGIVSADGSLLSDGSKYKPLSGTSMSTPHVAGVIALMLEANPALTPAQIVEVLKHTSIHRKDWGKTAPDDNPFADGDPNYHPSAGWGQVDGYAAVKEALRLAGDPASQTQVVAIDAVPAADGSAAIELGWESQRETGLAGYNIYRAEDVGGAPGAFTLLTAAPIPGTGQEAIEGLPNRNRYSYLDSDGLQPGAIYWYRIEHVSAAGTFQEPALPVVLGQPRPVAQLRYSITHNAFDNDLLVLLGSGPSADRPDFVIDGLSPEEAVSVTTEPGDALLGTTRYEFVQNLTTLDGVGGLLPPSDHQPWFLSVQEGGYVNRSGRVNGFELVTFDGDGNVAATYASADLAPQQTLEGGTVELWVPDSPTVTLPGESPVVIDLAPNAAAAGSAVAVEITGGDFLPQAGVFAGEGVEVTGVDVVDGSTIRANFAVAAGAASGPRDVTVTNLDGASDTLAAGFTVSGEDQGIDPEVVTLDDDDAAIGYRRGWHRRDSDAASGGGYHRRAGGGNGNGADSAAELVFDGDQVTFFYATSEGGGEADVLIDGALAATVSFAGSAPKDAPAFGESVTFDGLGDGMHSIEVVWRGGLAYVDGFQVTASDGEGSADASAVASRSITTASNATGTLLTHEVEVGAHDEWLSVNVDGAASPVTVQLLGPGGTLLGTAEAVLGSALYALDAPVSGTGTYTVTVARLGFGSETVHISTARSVRTTD